MTVEVTEAERLQRASAFLYGQVSNRLYALGYTERQASLMATGQPDMIRYIKTRGVIPGALALLALSRVLQTDMHWLIDEDYVVTGLKGQSIRAGSTGDKG